MLVEALTSQIAQKETLAQRGKHSILHMITREAADEEQRTLGRDNAQLREALAEKDQALKEKDNQIAELRQIGKAALRAVGNEIVDPLNLRERAPV